MFTSFSVLGICLGMLNWPQRNTSCEPNGTHSGLGDARRSEGTATSHSTSRAEPAEAAKQLCHLHELRKAESVCLAVSLG